MASSPLADDAEATGLMHPSASEKRPPIGLKWRSHTVFILGTVGMGIFTDFFLYAMLVPVLPFMLRDRVHVPENEIQSKIDYLLATYAGGAVLFSPIAGWLADKITSRQLPFLVGLLALFTATFLFAISETLWVLYLARLLQGVSAATVWSVGMALVVETVGAQNMGKAMGTIFSFMNPGTILSPTIGGAVYSNAGYLAVFLVAGGVLVFDFLLRMLMIEKRVARQYLKGCADQSDDGTSSADPNSDAGPSEDSPLLKSQQKLRVYKIPPGQPKRIIDFPLLYCLKDASLIFALFLAFVHAVLLGSFDATIPKFAEETFGFDSLQAGLLYIALGVPDGILSPIVGWLIDKYGTRPIALVGLAVTIPALIALRAVTDNTREHLVLYCILLATSGAGLAFAGTPSLVESGAVMQNYYDANKDLFNHRPPYAKTYGLLNMLFTLGLTIGPLASGGLKDAIGYGNMNAVLAGLAALTAVLAWLYLGKPPVMPDQNQSDSDSGQEHE